ncbi:TIGR03862 family flavoprotein [Paludibacterium yongneupense]|uniref:TIGR03862 family flavoprotein n=1 Tax=Paludibacterium yongneupense TaxID=400061 RepID=UPI001FE6EC65|nr:TIGR03862 family flavoprotein [Paludibacterium yongneupense]
MPQLLRIATMPDLSSPRLAIVGGGPAGLMAAEVLLAQGAAVDLYDAMPSPGRKFLLAGVGGMNITHSEPYAAFVARYGASMAHIRPWLERFGPQAVRDWVHGLGIDTFVGSSGRVFPVEMKAAPLLRAWLQRLREAGLVLHVRHRFQGWTPQGALRFATPDGETVHSADACLLALGGGSWAKLGSDGAWVGLLRGHGIDVAALRPANCGFDIGWSEVLRSRFAGAPLKSVAASPDGENWRRGECVITAGGIEGSLVYALSAALRDRIEAEGSATLYLDLAPDRDLARLRGELGRPRASASIANHLRRQTGIEGVKASLLRECLSRDDFQDMGRLAESIKCLPLRLTAPRPLDEAISSAGGVRFAALDPGLMLLARPGVFCAGEMLDWEAPTGGYLLTACLASGRHAAEGMLDWLGRRSTPG